MFIARCPETDAASKVTQYHLGGYILFARDFTGKTKEEVTASIQSYQNAAEIPLLIGVDEEGGTVNRVSKNTNLRETPLPLLRNCMLREDGTLFGVTHRKMSITAEPGD